MNKINIDFWEEVKKTESMHAWMVLNKINNFDVANKFSMLSEYVMYFDKFSPLCYLFTMLVSPGPVMSKFTIALREIGTYKEILRSQVTTIFCF